MYFSFFLSLIQKSTWNNFKIFICLNGYKCKTEHNLYTCYLQPTINMNININVNMNININININISCTFIKQQICLLMPAVKKFLEFSRVFFQPD